MATEPSPPSRSRLIDWLSDSATGAIIGLMHLLPYKSRLAAMGWLGRRVLGPLAFNRRIFANLNHVFPDLPEAEKRRICASVGDNFARSFIEIHSGPEFAGYAARSNVQGPGLPALVAARDAGRPVVLVSAHFGNYDAMRAWLLANGYPIGGLYMPMSNPRANRRYLAAISRIGEPLFERGPEGMTALIRFLRKGGMVGFLSDHYMAHGEIIDFLGKPARTATSAAKLALKYDAALIPFYATRRDDGVTFDIDVEAPIPPSDALTMTRALNDSASERVRKTPGQWFWLHRRWKRAVA